MNNEPVPEDLRELSWRRKLTPAEAARLRAWLAAHPEAQAECDSEAALTDALRGMPDAPMPSNFTAQVLQAVELEEARERRTKSRRFWSWRPAWKTRTAATALVIGLALFSFIHIQDVRKQTELARGLESPATVKVAAEAPRPEVLQDFDTIRRWRNPAPGAQIPVPDEQLLSLLQ